MTDTLDMWNPEEVDVNVEPEVLDVVPMMPNVEILPEVPLPGICLDCSDELPSKQKAVLDVGPDSFEFCTMVCACKWRRKNIRERVTSYLKLA